MALPALKHLHAGASSVVSSAERRQTRHAACGFLSLSSPVLSLCK
jgi:hypothetical protein